MIGRALGEATGEEPLHHRFPGGWRRLRLPWAAAPRRRSKAGAQLTKGVLKAPWLKDFARMTPTNFWSGS